MIKDKLIFKKISLKIMQLKSEQTEQLPYVNEVILRGKNLSLRSASLFYLLTNIENRFIYFQRANIGSVGQRAAKLLSLKIAV